MIALDAEPYSLVEREGFKNLMKHLAPRYVMPHRTYFSNTVIPQIYDNLSNQLLEELQKAKYLSFTTDIWTSSVNNESFIGLTAHFIDEIDFTSKSYVLNCKHFFGSHTGESIAEMLNITMERWNIYPERVHLIVRDNAANIILGTGKLFKI